MNDSDLSEQINKFIGRKIQELRLKNGISQEKLAEAIGKDTATAISYFESGLRNIRVDDLIKIARVLNVTVDEFLPEASRSVPESQTFAIKLRSNYKNLDKETEQSIINFAEIAKKKFKK